MYSQVMAEPSVFRCLADTARIASRRTTTRYGARLRGGRAEQRRHTTAAGVINGSDIDLPSSWPPQPLPPAPGEEHLQPNRRQTINHAKPFSEFLTDSFNRQHDYLRISVTERCNLRCLYCMPEEGVPLSPAAHLLTSPEIVYISSLFVSQGVTKIRLTGGEPTVRRDIVDLMRSIGALRSKGLRDVGITTNGLTLYKKLEPMVEAGLSGVNLSLDTLDPFQFQIMTRRKGYENVMKTMDRVLEFKKLGANIKLKINCVVMRGLNDREILPFVELGREKDVDVRFIEYMPFGGNKWSEGKMFPYAEMVEKIRAKYPDVQRVRGSKNDTAKMWQIPGFVGKIGFITSMTNDFCGTCNRLRITSDGNLKVCLHGNAEVSLRDILRDGNGGLPIDAEAFERLKQAEIAKTQHGVAFDDRTTLGWGSRERRLLQVIGAAVKRKKEKHAGMGELERMENRPMILIGPQQTTTSASGPSLRNFRFSSSSIPTNLLQPQPVHYLRRYSTRAQSKEWVEHTQVSHLRPKQPLPYRPSFDSVVDGVNISSSELPVYAPNDTDPENGIRTKPELTSSSAIPGVPKTDNEPKPAVDAAPSVSEIAQALLSELLHDDSTTESTSRQSPRYDSRNSQTASQSLSTKDAPKNDHLMETSMGEFPPSRFSLKARAAGLQPESPQSQQMPASDDPFAGTRALIAQIALDRRTQSVKVLEDITARTYSVEQQVLAIRLELFKLVKRIPGEEVVATRNANWQDLRRAVENRVALIRGIDQSDPQQRQIWENAQRRELLNRMPKVLALQDSVNRMALFDIPHLRTQLFKILMRIPEDQNVWKKRVTPKKIESIVADHVTKRARSIEQQDIHSDSVKNEEVEARKSWKESSELLPFIRTYPSSGVDTISRKPPGPPYNNLPTVKSHVAPWPDVNEPIIAKNEQRQSLKQSVNALPPIGEFESDLLDEFVESSAGISRQVEVKEPPKQPENISLPIRRFPSNKGSQPHTLDYTLKHLNNAPLTSHQTTAADQPEGSPSSAALSRSPSTAAAAALPPQQLTHTTATGEAHMVPVGSKAASFRRAIATGFVTFSAAGTLELIRQNGLAKGDVLATARVAGIMAAKNTPALIPLCHPIALSAVAVEMRLCPPGDYAGDPARLESWTACMAAPAEHADAGAVPPVPPSEAEPRAMQPGAPNGCVRIEARVETVGPTGVEMEALTAVAAAGLTIVDMVKAVDRFAAVQGVQMVLKSGGRSGLTVNSAWARDCGRLWGPGGNEVRRPGGAGSRWWGRGE